MLPFTTHLSQPTLTPLVERIIFECTAEECAPAATAFVILPKPTTDTNVFGPCA